MAYENITLRKRNVTMIDGYFYMIDEDQDALIVKTDDGTQAYSYPLDTTITNSIVSLEHDGRNFWSLENPGGGTIIIRRWYISNYVLTLRNTFTKSTDATDTWGSNAFTVEHYHVKFSGVTSAGTTSINVNTDGKFNLNDTGKLQSSMTVTFGPNASGETEEHTVVSVGAGSIGISAPGLAYSYDTNDPIKFYVAIWVFNNYDGLSSSSGALYKLNPYSPSAAKLTKISGGAYQNVQSATFFDMYDVFYDAAVPSETDFNTIAYIKATNMIFLDPGDLTNSFGSMTMDNLEDDQATTITIYDVTMEGSNVYRLQRKATYYGTTYTFNDSTYNYQLSTLEPFITSISLRAEPAILPANGVNTSEITAIVRDQFNLPIATKPVYFTDDDPNGNITTSPVVTNANGEAVTYYQAGTTAREVKITATAQQS